MRRGQREDRNKERCEECGRYKLYNTGGGLICTNHNCRHGISKEEDLLEVDVMRCNEDIEWLSKLKQIGMPSWYLERCSIIISSPI